MTRISGSRHDPLKYLKSLEYKGPKLDVSYAQYIPSIYRYKTVSGVAAETFFNVEAAGNSINYALFCNNSPSGQGTYGACHAAMGSPKNICDDVTKATLFATGLRHYDGDEEDAYFFWADILGPKSPWSRLGPFQVLFDGNKPVAVLVDVDDKTDNRYLTNFAIATRQPYERANNVRLYRVLREDGASLATSLVVSLSVNPNDNLVGAFFVGGHNPIDDCSSIDKLKKAEPTLEGDRHLLRKNGGYTPNTAIWRSEIRQALSNKDELFFLDKPAEKETAKIFNIAYAKMFHFTKDVYFLDNLRRICKKHDNYQ